MARMDEKADKVLTEIFPAAIWARKTLRLPSGDGFSLLELLVVLVLLALLAGIATVRLRLPYREARYADVVQRLGHTDQQIRLRARRSQRKIQLVCDLGQNTLYASQQSDDDLAHLQYVLPGIFRLGRICMADRASDSGRIVIPVAEGGQTASYALRLDVDAQPRQWLFFAGMSGQMTVLEAETDVDSLFEATFGGRPDAR